MAVTLSKGQGVSLKKSEHDLSQVTIGLGWDVKAPASGGFFGSLFGSKEAEYDLDVVAFLCDANGKVRDLGAGPDGQATLVNSDVIFFNNQKHRSGCIWLTGDNRTGAGDGDDEQIIVRLNDLPDHYAKVVFVVQIYQGTQNKQSFGQVDNAFIRAEDQKGREMVRFSLTGGAGYGDCRSLLFAELVRENGGWQFKAVGQPSGSDNFVEWLKQYV
jgi:stress response protein SCP2